MFSIKQDNFVMEQLKCQEVRHYIADTNKGALTLMLRKGETKYIFVLDAVPVEKDVHDELMAVLFPVKDPVPQVNREHIKELVTIMKDSVLVEPPKKRGRPAKIK